ncbi:hypothetical protein BDV93DRAFT_521101 [Ceratobasidium sp. AG-I]|nr:hypothetical protein BDV93DRAFT_521101 [Ceratobasidium sp. AG-I]
MRKTPGPVATSCLTCRRRRKKCDRQRPTCEQCAAGKFECLGYDYPSKHINVPGLGEPSRPRVLPLGLQDSGSSQTMPISRVAAPSDDAPAPSMLDSLLVLYPESDRNNHLLGSTSAYEFDGLSSTSGLESNNAWVSISDQDGFAHTGVQSLALGSSVASDYGNALALPATSVSGASGEPRISSGDLARLTAVLPHFQYSPNKRISSYMFSPPRDLSPVPTQVKEMVDFVVSQYDRFFSFCHSNRIPEGAATFRELTIQRAFTSSTTRSIMFLGAKIIDSIFDGTLFKKYNYYNQWIERFQHDLWSRTQNLTSNEAQIRLVDTLELNFVIVRVANRFNLHQLLQNLAPVFLQVVFSDSTLWPSDYYSTSVSLAHILASNRYELHCLALLDMLCSMTCGLPQVIEYDTSVPVFSTNKHSLDVFPAELQILLVEINTRCFQKSVANDWNGIEQRLLSWQPPLPAAADGDSWKTIVELAVYESWRQTLLIYLYMAVCKISSDDSRVQSSVRQIFQLINSAENPNLSPVDPHFFLQYLIAGTCARAEKQRALARERLMELLHGGSWFWQGSDFVSVLDHLWHGAGANGHPIRWSDYIASHQSVLSSAM